MNKILKVITLFVLGLIGYACSPEEYGLGNLNVKSGELVEGIAFKIEHDNVNPNIVRLTSLMDNSFTPLWDHPQGRSQKHEVTLKMPFPGTYTVKFGVQTRGGVVYGEPVTFTVDDFYAPFVEDELWELISGGVDNEKTWYLDLDADALSRNFLGPLYFYGTNNGWQGECIVPGSDNTTCWNWNPDYKGNSWLMTAANFGSMTFDLKGAANVKVVHNTISDRGTETGTYLLDAEGKTLRMTDASPLHDSNRDGVVVDWGNIRIFSLTKDFMQLGVLRDPALSGEGAAYLVYNYISKDYFDNWVPGEVVEPEPPYTGNPNDDLTTSTTTKKKWVMSLNTPYNFAGLNGAMLNAWNSAADYAATGWAPYDATMIANISLTLDKTGATAGNYEFTTGSGSVISGGYTVDAANHIVFDKAISFDVSGWVKLETTSENKLRIIRTDVDALGNISKIWLGKRDPIKPEYQVYGFEPVAAGSADPAGALKALLTTKTWRLDSDRSYDVTTSWGAEQGPVIFSDYATWAWNPLPGEHYAAGEEDINYGTIKFNANGTVVVNQRKRIYTYTDGDGNTATRNGAPETGDVLASDDVVALNGTWSLDYDEGTITMSVGVLHPWTANHTVADWGALKFYKIQANAILLQVTRSAVLSGESEMPVAYVYVSN